MLKYKLKSIKYHQESSTYQPKLVKSSKCQQEFIKYELNINEYNFATIK